MRVARIPYLNSQPFYGGFASWSRVAGEGAEPIALVETVPAELGRLARRGAIDAGLIPLVDAFAVRDDYERLGPYGIASRGEVESVLLLAERPIERLGGTAIGVTEESSTSFRLLRLLIEVRHGAAKPDYRRGVRQSVEACLLIGDEALAATAAGPPAPLVYDLAEEWWRWQGLPFVFAVWVVRRSLSDVEKAALAAVLEESLSRGDGLDEIAAAYASGTGFPRLGPAHRLRHYLGRFAYRLGPDEERAIVRFRGLLEQHGLLGEAL